VTRRGLQVFLTLLGGIALIAGTLSVLFGVYIVPDHGRVTASVDSEMRFYAVWYAAMGLVVLRVVPKVEAAQGTVRAVAAAYFIAGCARLISLFVVGKPHFTQVALMAVELVLPLVIVPWQSAVSRQLASSEN
jgi:hypothetical protein